MKLGIWYKTSNTHDRNINEKCVKRSFHKIVARKNGLNTFVNDVVNSTTTQKKYPIRKFKNNGNKISETGL